MNRSKINVWMWLIGGAALGAIAGLVAGNLAPGIVVGIVLGVTFAYATGRRNRG